MIGFGFNKKNVEKLDFAKIEEEFGQENTWDEFCKKFTEETSIPLIFSDNSLYTPYTGKLSTSLQMLFSVKMLHFFLPYKKEGEDLECNKINKRKGK